MSADVTAGRPGAIFMNSASCAGRKSAEPRTDKNAPGYFANVASSSTPRKLS